MKLTKYTTLVLGYYVVIATVIGIKAIDIVRNTSILISEGRNVRQLQYDKNQLLESSKILENEITKKYSLAALSDDQLKSYNPITNTIVLPETSNVALR